METVLLFFLALLPGGAIVAYFRKKDILEKEPWKVVFMTFLLGAFTVIPVAFLQTMIDHEGESLLGLIVEYIAIVALTEELCKFLVIRLYSLRNPAFNEITDGLVYGAAAAGGFATLENIFYVLEEGWVVGMLRAVLSVPSHIFEGAIIGYWFGKLKLGRTSLLQATLFGLGIPIIAHGFYDVVLSYDSGSYFGIAILIVIGLGVLTWIYFRSAFSQDQALGFRKETLTIATSEGVVSLSESETYSISPGVTVLRMALIGMSIMSIVTGLFFVLGGFALLAENDPEYWVGFAIAAIPLLIGVFLLYYATRRLGK